MSKYNTFLAIFILSVIAFIFFLVFYLMGIFSFMMNAHELTHATAFDVLGMLFSPTIIISGVILAVTSLIYRILGIVYVVNNKTVSDGEKALWIIGFIIMGFVTAIVFLILARGRKFVA